MPKFPTFPTLYDEVLQISISKLKEWGYLKPGQIKSGTIDWSRNGNHIAQISIEVQNLQPQPFLELSYNFNDEPRKYRVNIVSIPSNIGMGEVYYFFCPKPNKRCRKLYLVGGYFLHREAFKVCMYVKQTRSKKTRNFDNLIGSFYRSDKIFEEFCKRNFKKSYSGKPTKRYLKLLKEIKELKSVNYADVQKALVS